MTSVPDTTEMASAQVLSKMSFLVVCVRGVVDNIEFLISTCQITGTKYL